MGKYQYLLLRHCHTSRPQHSRRNSKHDSHPHPSLPNSSKSCLLVNYQQPANNGLHL
jgi:hypothetical protein